MITRRAFIAGIACLFLLGSSARRRPRPQTYTFPSSVGGPFPIGAIFPTQN